jgi:hypothetical protein
MLARMLTACPARSWVPAAPLELVTIMLFACGARSELYIGAPPDAAADMVVDAFVSDTAIC